MSLEILRKMVRQAILAEAKKKEKKKKGLEQPEVRVDGHMEDKRLDFSQPLGAMNTYKMQGASNAGPYTNDKDSMINALSGVDLETPLYGSKLKKEAYMNRLVRQTISEALAAPDSSVWSHFNPRTFDAPNGIWENAERLLVVKDVSEAIAAKNVALEEAKKKEKDKKKLKKKLPPSKSQSQDRKKK